MRFAVTDGARYIGSALIKGLVEDGDTVTSIDNLTRAQRDPKGLYRRALASEITNMTRARERNTVEGNGRIVLKKLREFAYI